MALTQISTQGIKDGTITGSDLATNIDLVDNQKIRFGNSPDLEIYHSGTASFISDVGGGVLKLTTDGLRVRNAADNQNMIKADQNDAVELYHNNLLRLQTESYGVSITGSLISSGTLQSNGGNIQLLSNSQKIFAGAGQDLGIFHDGTNSFIENTTGNLHIRPKAAEEGIKIIPDGAVELYHIGSKRFETTTAGAKLSGTQTVQAGAFSTNVTTGNKTFTANIDIQATSMRGGVVVRNMNDFRSESVFNASFMHYDPFDTTANSFAFRAARGSTLADTFSVRSDGRTFVGERLSIGEASPSHKLHISADENTTIAYFDTDLGGRGLKINTFVSGNAASAGVEFEAPAGANKSAFVFKGASEFMRIHPSGKIGIGGVTNPEVMLDIRANDPGIQLLDTSQTSAYGNMDFAGDTLVLTSRGGTSSHGFTDFRTYNGSAIRTNMRIGSSGEIYFGGTNWPTGSLGKSAGRVMIGKEGLLTVWNETHSAGGGGTLKLACKAGNDSTRVGFANLTAGPENSSNFASFFRIQVANSGGSGITCMQINSSGNVGIGTTNPNVSGFNTDARVLTISGPKRALIELRGNIQAADTIGVIRFMSGNNNEAAIVSIADSGFAGDLRFRTHGGERMVIDKNGNIGAPSGTNIHNASDVRLKKNIVDLDKGLSAIKSLRPVSFNWIDGFCDKEKNTLYGFIAQEVETVDSNLIQQFGNGSVTVEGQTINDTLRVNEKFLIPMLVKAIQELEAKVAALEAG